MNISLPPEQQKWLEAQVAAGRFASIDEALAVAVADLRAVHADDLAWAKPHVDEARASLARYHSQDRARETLNTHRRDHQDD